MSSKASGGAAERMTKAVGLGAGIGALVTAAILAVAAALMASGLMPVALAQPAAIAAAVLGSGAAGLVSARASGENGMLCGALAGAVMFLLMWIAGGVIGVGDVGLEALLRFIEAVVPAALGGVLGVNFARRRKL